MTLPDSLEGRSRIRRREARVAPHNKTLQTDEPVAVPVAGFAAR